MAQETDQVADINNGPGKWDLMLALFERGEERFGYARPITITVQNSEGSYYDGLLIVHSVRATDGSREQWEIIGLVALLGHPYTAQYSTRTRRGRLTIHAVG